MYINKTTDIPELLETTIDQFLPFVLVIQLYKQLYFEKFLRGREADNENDNMWLPKYYRSAM